MESGVRKERWKVGRREMERRRKKKKRNGLVAEKKRVERERCHMLWFCLVGYVTQWERCQNS